MPVTMLSTLLLSHRSLPSKASGTFFGTSLKPGLVYSISQGVKLDPTPCVQSYCVPSILPNLQGCALVLCSCGLIRTGTFKSTFGPCHKAIDLTVSAHGRPCHASFIVIDGQVIHWNKALQGHDRWSRT